VKPKLEGRTQLVGYAVRNRLAETTNQARKMDLELLRRVVALHRKAIANQNHQWGIDDKSIAEQLDTAATNAEKE